jgi:hypothetical protein
MCRSHGCSGTIQAGIALKGESTAVRRLSGDLAILTGLGKRAFVLTILMKALTSVFSKLRSIMRI